EWTLEVRELDDRYRRNLWSADGRAVHFHFVDGIIHRWGLRRGRNHDFGLRLLHQLLVRPRVLERLFDLGLECTQRLRTDKNFAIDEHRWCAARTDLRARLHVRLDRLLELVGVHRCREPLHVEPELLCVAVEAWAIERLLVLEQQIMHLPELALL